MLLNKLFTHEDGAYMHMHKVIGVLVLAHYAWRAWLLLTTGFSGLDGGLFTAGCIAVHALLHLTSFQFRLDNRRNRVHNIIWPEMRWHTAIFAMRSVAVLVAMWLASSHGHPQPFQSAVRALATAYPEAARSNAAVALAGAASELDRLLPDPDAVKAYMPAIRIAVVVLTMLFADIVSAILKPAGGTTMRGNPFPPGVPEVARRLINGFYSLSQAAGTIAILCSTDMTPVLFVMLPIQTAPLLMTLVRKGILQQRGWHMWYAASILVAYGVSAAVGAQPGYVAVLTWPKATTCTLLFGVLRFALRMNKYVVWSAIAAVIWLSFI